MTHFYCMQRKINFSFIYTKLEKFFDRQPLLTPFYTNYYYFYYYSTLVYKTFVLWAELRNNNITTTTTTKTLFFHLFYFFFHIYTNICHAMPISTPHTTDTHSEILLLVFATETLFFFPLTDVALFYFLFYFAPQFCLCKCTF